MPSWPPLICACGGDISANTDSIIERVHETDYIYIDRYIDRQIDRQTDRWMDGGMDRQTDRQTQTDR